MFLDGKTEAFHSLVLAATVRAFYDTFRDRAMAALWLGARNHGLFCACTREGPTRFAPISDGPFSGDNR